MPPPSPAPANVLSPRPAPGALLAAIWGTLGVLLWTAACTAPLVSWNAPRLASAYALAAGQAIYPAIGSGAQLGWFYGPGMPVWHLPVTLIHTPSLAMAVASPPPMHSEATPRLPPVARSAAISVTTRRAPLAPIG